MGPFEYAARLSLDVEVPADHPDHLQAYQAELVGTTSALPATDSPRQWAFLNTDLPHRLTVSVVTDSTSAADHLLDELAERYLDRLRAAARAALANPTVTEQSLDERLTHLRSALSDALQQQRELDRTIETGDPRRERNVARAELHDRRRDYSMERRVLSRAQRRLDELSRNPVPENPPIDPADRARIRQADVEYQQDLAELQLHLATARDQLITAGQESAPFLRELLALGDELGDLGRRQGAQAGTGAFRTAFERAVEAIDTYRRSLRAFSQSWENEFTPLRELDGQAGYVHVLEAEDRLSRLLGDFLYEASTALSAVREQVRAIGGLSDNQARHHVMIADLTRGFHALQASHHRFEFAAAAVRRAENFRLAAAIKSARGLSRRSQMRAEMLEAQLREQTRQAAIKARRSEMAELEQRIASLRSATDNSVDSIFNLQDRLDELVPDADRAVGNRALSEDLDQRIGRLAEEVAAGEQQLAALAAARESPLRPDAVRVAERSIDPTPVNLPRRIAYGWAAGVTTFLLLFSLARFTAPRRNG